jgi:hypothetical protein
MTEYFYVSFTLLWIYILTLSTIYVLNLATARKQHSGRVEKIAGQEFGLDIGEDISKLTLTDLYGNSHSLSESKVKGTLLFFTSSTCSACHVVFSDIKKHISELSDYRLITSFRLSSEDKALSPDDLYALHGIPKEVIVIPEPENFTAEMRVTSYPFAFLVTSGGRILRKGIMTSILQIRLIIK